MTDADYTDDLTLLANTIAKEFLQHSLEWAAEGIDHYVNANNIEYMYSKQNGATSTVSGKPLK